MKEKYDEEAKGELLVPETKLEAVESLFEFLSADMWHERDYWKNQKDMIKYLKTHFDICIKEMKDCKK